MHFVKHFFWGCYIDDAISLRNYGGKRAWGVLDHHNAFTVYLRNGNSKFPFLDVLIICSLDKLNFTIYRKPTQNNRYLHFK